ncbi:MAG: response regulator [Planctomycetota bacterium]|nr:MAG: response regulator [Planctomycetota bacterium]
MDVRQVVRDVLELLSRRAFEQNISLTGEIAGKVPAHIESDPVRLKQALTNLVGNAVKFTRHGGVRVILQYDATTNRLLFRVRDSGIGIPADRLERIFEPFTQADDSTTRRFGGTGLGLTLTRDIARALGGDVTVRSEVGRGSEFTLAVSAGSLAGVQFVTAADIGPSSAAPSAPPTNLPRIDGRVLLVEDGPDNRRLFSFILRKAGAAFDVAEDGREGLEKTLDAWRTGNPFDVILMDMQMPVMDGRQATQELRRAGYGGTIIALTAHATREELEGFLEIGCDHYLSKPIDRATLVREVAAAVRRARSGAPVAGECFSEDRSSASRA